MIGEHVDRFVFSSSVAVYGMPDRLMIEESLGCVPINPYGRTKLIGEWMIDDAMAASSLNAVKLRYFNVAGAGWQELADTAVTNLVPIALQALVNKRAPVIFGDDYTTQDGTCIRDCVHVKDLARAHIDALDALAQGRPAFSTFNVGTGQGASVREVIDAISVELGVDVKAQSGTASC